MTEKRVPWGELTPTQKAQFCALLGRMGIDIDNEGEAKAYYGNKEKVKADAEN